MPGSFIKSTVETLEKSMVKIQYEGRRFLPVPSFKEMDKGGREGERDRGRQTEIERQTETDIDISLGGL